MVILPIRLQALQAAGEDKKLLKIKVMTHADVKKFLKGVLRYQGGKKCDKRFGITALGLAKLFHHIQPVTLNNVMARAWMSVSYSGLFRWSEYSAIRWTDLQFLEDKNAVFVRVALPFEKCLLTRTEDFVDITPGAHIDPVAELHDLLQWNAGDMDCFVENSKCCFFCVSSGVWSSY